MPFKIDQSKPHAAVALKEAERLKGLKVDPVAIQKVIDAIQKYGPEVLEIAELLIGLVKK